MNLRRRMFTSVGSIVGVVAVILLQNAVVPVLHAADNKVDEIISRHLDSIGTTEARASAKSRIVQGTSRFRLQVGGGGELQGASALVSEGRKSVLMIKLGTGDYRGEQFVTDGDKVFISATAPNHRRSSLGELVHSQDQLVREGLLGGTLTTAWALLNLAENKPRLNFDGEKKVDGRPVLQVTYHSRAKDDLTVHLYFDPQTYRHVMTTYGITLASGIAPGSDVTQSSKQKDTRYTIEERFSDFKTAEGITLPSKYVIHFTEELQDGTTNVYEWDLTADEISNNRPLDPKNFQVK